MATSNLTYKKSNGKYNSGYKSIPKWVCRNLLEFKNCFVGIKLYDKMASSLEEYLKGTNYSITDYENGKIIKIYE